MRPLRVVVVGSGPSGFYAAEALLRQKEVPVSVDMLDRLPTPFGLVRGGVAPDHQKIKSVVKVYERTAADPRLRFFGNVRLGSDVPIEDLRRHFDCLVYAVGNESDKKLGVPGEDLAGSHAATEFVGWYNSHPDYRDRRFDLSVERAAVIGIGNVAMDVTRILAAPPESLASTDIAGYALEALRASRIREIVVLGRRGPAQAAFSPAEIQEIAELQGSDLVVAADESALDPVSKDWLEKNPDPEAAKNVLFLHEVARRGEGGSPRKVRLRLCASPVELLGEGGRVKALRVERNRIVPDGRGGVKAEGTGRFETLEAGLVLRSVGYYGVAIPGVPFDPKLGRIPNAAGRVLDPKSFQPLPGEYVVGWAKRGPSGLIGTNRADSAVTVENLLADFRGRPRADSEARTPEAALSALRARAPELVTFEDWKRLDRLETEAGAASGKVREKFASVAEMLAAVRRARQGTTT